MTSRTKGFSLIELTVAMTITLGIGMVVFQLFHQSERTFRDQTLTIEMHQSARVVASQIADEVRMAGQGIPVYASRFDAGPSEPVTAILPTSTTDRIDFRANLSNIETRVTTAMPLDLTIGTPVLLSVGSGSQFLGGRFVYVSGPTVNSMWAWVRAELTGATATTLNIVPRQAGDAGRTADTIRFTQNPTISLEEAVSISLNAGSVRRAAAVDLTNPASPIWTAANEIGRNFTTLQFAYFDENGNPVTPDSLPNRFSIARVDVRVTAQTADPLTSGRRATYPLSLRTIPRNLQLR